jgi:GPH family glycoside/pentoside/hexuronide:cation symporter
MNAFARTRERVRPVEEKPVPVKTALKSVLNLPWFLLMALVIFVNLSLTIKNMSTIYYMEYNLNRPDLTSAMLTVPNLVLLVAIVLSPFISKRMGKRNACLLGVGIGIAGSAVVAFSGDHIPLLFGGTMLAFLGLGLPAGLIGAMFADTVDFIEWKTGVRSQGLIYSASSIGIKIGQGLGGALGAGLLALGNYVPNMAQAASSLAAIQFSFAWVILISLLLLEILLVFYNVDKLYPQITSGLEERRSRAAAPSLVPVE